MIAAWMLFAIVLSGLLFLSASIAEGALRQLRRPVRIVWVVAIAGANVLPIVLAKVPTFAAESNRGLFAVASDSVFARLNGSLLIVWGVAAAIGVLICASAMWRIARTRIQWKREHVDNMPVLVSHDVGPALVGVMQYSIVVPQWAHTLDIGARRLLLVHEQEHARKYDPLLLSIAALAVVVAPWNVFNWVFFRRLHLAVELDCDQRVLRAHPDTRRYGALLLDVAERVLPSVIPAAAFVEHGASLETRINAMNSRRVSFHALRGGFGLALSLLFALAACFTPRPYAIIIVNPPASVAAGQTAPASGIPASERASTHAAPVSTPSDPIHASMESSRAASAVAPANAPTKAAANALASSEAELRPVAPGARVRALDEAENVRMRNLVARNAPRALGNFSRGDSALLLLLSDDGQVLKQAGIPLWETDAWDPLHVFTSVFLSRDVNSFQSASLFTIDSGANNQPLGTPLKLFTAHLIPGLPTPRTIAEMTPSRDRLLTDARGRHPEAFTDNTAQTRVVAMLYDTKGTLLRTALVPYDTVPTTDQNALWRKAFGAYTDLGTVVHRGTQSFAEPIAARSGGVIIAYGIMMMRSEIADIEKVLQFKHRNWTWGGASSRAGRGRSFDMQAMTARLRVMVHTRVPDAYGDWARGDSAVVFIFDANDQLIGRKTGPITERTGMLDLAEYISMRELSIPSGDIEAAGWTNHVTSESGRVLDKPLVVYWGRLSGEATRKRELSRASPR